MNNLVRLITTDDGDTNIDPDIWHLVDPANPQGTASLCTQEFFGGGESACEFEMKTAKRGGVTCQRCIDIVKIYKAVKL